MTVIKNKRSVISVILCLVLLTFILTSCSKTSSSSSTSTSSGTVASNVTSAVSSGAPETVSIGLATNINVEDYETNYYTQYLEELMNIDIKFVLFEDIATKFSILVASGSELPDIILNNFDNATLTNYVSQGVFVPLTQYWNNPDLTINFDKSLNEELGSDPNKVASMRKDVLAGVTLPDNHIYSLFQYDEGPWNQMYYRMWINDRWRENLGLKTPTTTDEFRDMLQAFVTKDPNGNGKKDEYGLIGSTGGYGQSVVPFLLNAFIDANPNYNYFRVQDGVVSPAFTEDAFKEGLMYLNELCSSGLLDPISFTQDQTQMRAMLNGGDVNQVGALTAGSYSHWSGGQFSERFKEYTLLEPPTGPKGVSYTPTKKPVPVGIFYITKDADNPELCFKIGEANYDLKARFTFRHGAEDKHWTTDPQILSQCVSRFSTLGYEPKYVVFDKEDIWGKPNNYIWNAEVMPIFATKKVIFEAAAGLKSQFGENYVSSEETHYKLYAKHSPAEMLGSLIYTNDEREALASVKTIIDSYVNESIAAFITGNLGFNQWDGYIAELKSMGLDQYTSILQTVYDRMYK